jgi:hypothetical protein
MKSTHLFVVCILLFVILFSGCNSYRGSSHHALIKISISASGQDALNERRKKQEEILALSTDIITDFGLKAVTDEQTPFNTSVFGNYEHNQVMKYKGQATGKENTIPLEALVVFDSKEYKKISITLSEGYSLNPSKRLSDMYSRLDEALDEIEVNKYLSKIW